MIENDPEAIHEKICEALSKIPILDPDDIEGDIFRALLEVAPSVGWESFGDGRDEWQEKSVCSICGSCLPWICGHENDPAQAVHRGIQAVEFLKNRKPA